MSGSIDKQRIHDCYVDTIAEKYSGWYRQVEKKFNYLGCGEGEIDRVGFLPPHMAHGGKKKVDIFEVKTGNSEEAIEGATTQLKRAERYLTGRGWEVVGMYIFSGRSDTLYGLYQHKKPIKLS